MFHENHLHQYDYDQQLLTKYYKSMAAESMVRIYENILNVKHQPNFTGFLKIDCTRQLLLPSRQVPQSAVPDPKTKWPVRRMERSWPTHGSPKRTLSRKVPAPKSHRNISDS
jgi:hypothetical protein